MSQLPLPAQLALAFATAFIVTLVATPLAARLARRLGVVAVPRGDRWHRQPTPLLGGIALYAGLMLPAVALVPLDGRTAGLLASSTVMFLVGLVDDIKGLPPYGKLAAQIAVACLLLILGVRVDIIPFAFLAIPVAVFWIIGITNAFNLLDNMDGLSAGTAAIVGLVLFVHTLLLGDVETAMLSLVLAGAALGFLVYNSHPARIFMGDSGSLTLGFLLAGLALTGTHATASNLFVTLLVPVAIMALPIFDTTLVTVQRALHGRSIAQGGRDHLSHRLVALGLTERQAVVALYAISALSGTLALASSSLDVWTTLVFASLLALGIIVFGIFLAEVRIYSEASYAQLRQLDGFRDRPVINGLLFYKRQMTEVILDFFLICLAYLSAYLLKYEGAFSGQFLTPFAESLPYLIPAKLAMLFAFGVYRPVWQYAGVHDVGRVAQATAAGSVLAVALVLMRFEFAGYSRSVFVVDWLVLTTLMVGARLSFAVLRDWFRRLPRREGRRVLIVGAEDGGEMVLRTILRDGAGTYRPVGFLDDDPAKRHRTIHGVPILGSTGDLVQILGSIAVDELVIAVPGNGHGPAEGIAQICVRLGIPHRDAGAFLALQVSGEDR